MAGISSKAAGSLINSKKYNSYELNTDFDLNLNESFYRLHDPQIGRFWQIDPKAEKYFCLNPYMAMACNPILIFDILGDDLELTGKKKNVQEAIDEMNRILDGFYIVSKGKNGKIQITKTDKEGEMSKQSAGFYEILSNVVGNKKGTAIIEVVKNDSKIDIDGWNTKKLDIGDIKQFGDGKYMSSASVFAHTLAEQESFQIENNSSIGKTESDFNVAYERDHAKGKKAEGIVTGYPRSSSEGDGTRRKFLGNTNGPYRFIYYEQNPQSNNSEDYIFHHVDVKFKNGNVKNVKTVD